MEEVESGSQENNVTSDIVETAKCRTLEAVLWNGVSDIFDSVIWNFELVSVSIEETAVWLVLSLLFRTHGAQ